MGQMKAILMPSSTHSKRYEEKRMRFYYFAAWLDDDYELTITMVEVPAADEAGDHFIASVVALTLRCICDECDWFIQSAADTSYEGWDIELDFPERDGTNENSQIYELCLVDGSLAHDDLVARLHDIKAVAQSYLGELLLESTHVWQPSIGIVNWKKEGF